MFRVTKCSSSGESIVSIRPLAYVTVSRWPCGMQALSVHTTWSPTYSDIYQRSYWYNWPSWWWALGYSKHVENWNKQIYEKELCVKLVIYKDSNKIHGQQNIKSIFFYVLLTLQFSIFIFCCPCSSVYLCFADSAVQYIYVLLTVQFSIFMFFWQCSSVYLS